MKRFGIREVLLVAAATVLIAATAFAAERTAIGAPSASDLPIAATEREPVPAPIAPAAAALTPAPASAGPTATPLAAPRTDPGSEPRRIERPPSPPAPEPAPAAPSAPAVRSDTPERPRTLPAPSRDGHEVVTPPVREAIEDRHTGLGLGQAGGASAASVASGDSERSASRQDGGSEPAPSRDKAGSKGGDRQGASSRDH